MRTFEVWAHPDMGMEAVKQGWSWPGAIFTWIWAYSKRLTNQGTIMLAVSFGVPLVGDFIAAGSLDTGLGWELAAGEILGLLASLAISVYAGARGNGWWRADLANRGYRCVATLAARSPSAAVAEVREADLASVESGT